MPKLFPLIALTSLTIVLTIPNHAYAQDYLSPELREQIDQLKADVQSTPTNNTNGRERAHLVWEWSNAYALSGKHIPANTTASMNKIMNAPETTRLRRASLRRVDDYVREFTVYDEQPDALGELEMLTPGPYPIETWQTLRVRYTVGTMPLQPGGVIMINRHFISDAGRWQATDPAGDNYISIASSNSEVKFVATTAPWSGMHGGFRGAAEQLAYRVEGAELSKSDTFTVTYGDTSGGSRGYKMQTFTSDAVPFPMHIKFSKNDVFFEPPVPVYQVIGGEVAKIQGFAPSVVGTGENFSVSVRADDRYRNRAEGDIPELTVSLNGKEFRTLSAGSEAIQIMSELSIDEPGIYRFSFSSPDGSISGTSNPVSVRDNPEHRIYWGETHGHSGFAEGLGSAEGYFIFGRDDARLDFLTLSEHDIWMDDSEWNIINTMSKKYTEEGKFIAFPGYEWTSPRARGGHHNVFFNGYDFDRVPVQEAHYLSDLYFQLQAKYDVEDVLIIPHAHQAGDWRENNVYMQRLVEIMSMHGTFEWFGKKYLENGSQVGFISASDDHLGHPGYTSGNSSVSLRQLGGLAAVFAPSLTNDAIFSGLRNRDTYATTGDRIILEAEVNGFAMGTRQPFNERRVISGTVNGSAAIIDIALIKNGDVIETKEYLKTELQPKSFVQVGFESETEVFFGRDNPRGYRPWTGFIEVEGARIVDVTAPGFQNPRSEWARMDEDDPGRVNITTATRGRLNNLVLELEGADEDTRIRIVLNEGRESGTAPVQIRPPARIPGSDTTFKLSDLSDSEIVKEFRVGRHTDRLSITVINPDASMDQAFSFRDDENPQHGDNYYIRVRQLNGGIAWSSPFWIGGETPS